MLLHNLHDHSFNYGKNVCAWLHSESPAGAGREESPEKEGDDTNWAGVLGARGPSGLPW